MSLTPSEILATIPGWEDATVTRLTGGLTNKSWRVTKEGHSGVLKIDDEERRPPLNTRHAEALVQTTAANIGLASNVIFADEFCYFAEYVEGTVWSPACLIREGRLENIAAALKRLHALPLTGRSFDASTAAERYVEKVRGLDSSTIETCMTILSGSRQADDLCCCHNDLVAENLIATPDLMFLDWEYACDNDPLFDLATIVEHHELGDEQTSRLLYAYFGEDAANWRGHLEQQRVLYLALLCLWTASRPDSCAKALARIVVRLTTKPEISGLQAEREPMS